jgi:hypothetical protein
MIPACLIYNGTRKDIAHLTCLRASRNNRRDGSGGAFLKPNPEISRAISVEIANPATPWLTQGEGAYDVMSKQHQIGGGVDDANDCLVG